MAIDPTQCGANFTERELWIASLALGADGIPIERYVLVTDTGDDFVSCGQDPSTIDPKQLYGLDSNGKVARRISIDGL